MPRRFDLTDSEWSLIVPLLPQKSRGVAVVDDRRGQPHFVAVPDRQPLETRELMSPGQRIASIGKRGSSAPVSFTGMFSSCSRK